MRNVKMEVKGNILSIMVDLSQPGETSRSGKSTVIGSTEGNAKISDTPVGEVFVGLNVYRK